MFLMFFSLNFIYVPKQMKRYQHVLLHPLQDNNKIIVWYQC